MLWLITERSLQIALLLIIGGLIARNFGPELFGKWQYALTVLTIATTLTYFCGSEVIVPRLVRNRDESGEIMGTAFLIRLTASVVGFLLASFTIELLVTDNQTLFFSKVLLYLLFLYEPFAVVIAWFQSRTHIAPIVKIRLGALALKCGLVALIFLSSDNYSLIPFTWVTEGIILAIFLVILYRKSPNPKWRVTQSTAVSLLREGAVYWIGLLFMIAFTRVDRVFLAEFSSFSSLGVYSSALQISETWFTFAGLLTQSFAPRYIYGCEQKEEINHNLKRIMTLFVVIACSGSLTIYFLSNLIINLIFGHAYAEAIPLLQLSSLISIFVFADSALNSLMLKERATGWVAAKWLAAFSCAFFINLWLYSSLSTYAPLLGLLTGYMVACLIGVIYWRRWRGALPFTD